MQRNLFILALVLLTTTSGFGINRRMMEDKTMVGFQAGFVLPMTLDGETYFNTAPGGGLRGKYFGTNTFAFGFDLGFFFPQIQTHRLEFITDSLTSALQREQRLGRVHESVEILEVLANAQYIPFNLSFEFYLPSHALNNFRPYFALGVGLHMVNRRYKPVYNAPMHPGTGLPAFEQRVQLSSKKGFFSVSPTVGALWTLDELWNINMDLRYNQLLGTQGGGALSVHLGVILDLSFKYVR